MPRLQNTPDRASALTITSINDIREQSVWASLHQPLLGTVWPAPFDRLSQPGHMESDPVPFWLLLQDCPRASGSRSSASAMLKCEHKIARFFSLFFLKKLSGVLGRSSYFLMQSLHPGWHQSAGAESCCSPLWKGHELFSLTQTSPRMFCTFALPVWPLTLFGFSAPGSRILVNDKLNISSSIKWQPPKN